ncbi:DUF3567 domain-containing protein [Methylibium sp.]|uniref:BTH_I0359 family protein n=1 Tax=Methylibium sp. TaxID=2067992 RepID=UPI002869FDF2|nr:DUF3567 domain-containing protein [Methylibium sp.]
MHMVYNSDNFAVVQFVVAIDGEEPVGDDVVQRTRGGFEIVDKFARKELFLEGEMAEHFKLGVEALIQSEPGTDEIDAFLAGYTTLAHQPVVLH